MNGTRAWRQTFHQNLRAAGWVSRDALAGQVLQLPKRQVTRVATGDRGRSPIDLQASDRPRSRDRPSTLA
jgi:hypothetical protein